MNRPVCGVCNSEGCVVNHDGVPGEKPHAATADPKAAERCPTHGEPILLAIGDEWCCNACVQARLAALSASRAGAVVGAERMRRALERYGAHTPRCASVPLYNWATAKGPCDCGLSAALSLSPASGGVREAIEAFAEAMWKDGHTAGAKEHFDSPLPSRLFKQVDAFLASLPGPDPAMEAEGKAALLAIEAVRAAPVNDCDEDCPPDCHAAKMRAAVEALAALSPREEDANG